MAGSDQPHGAAGVDRIVRSASPIDDAVACAAIYERFVNETAVSFEEVAPTAAEMAARIEASRASYDWLVLEAGGEIAGYAYAAPHRERAAYRWAIDTSVYIAAAHQRSGVGRALYSELLARMRRQRFEVACAGITLPNDASVGLHESFGFELVGVYRRIGWKQGAWHDVGWWQLELAPAASDPPEPLSRRGR